MTAKYSNVEWNGKKVIIGTTTIQTNMPIHVVIGFHGAGSTPENILIYGNKLELSNAIMVYPEGPIDDENALWSWWQDGPNQMETVAEFLNFTTQIINHSHDHVNREYPGRLIRTSLWGFSQGAAAALVYTLLGSKPLHKTASICGFLPETPAITQSKDKPLEVLGIFGSHDEVVPSFLAEHALDEMKNYGHTVTAKETQQTHQITAENLEEINSTFNS